MDTTSLTNFNVPNPLKSRFDAICHASGRTRTSVLVELMTDYILNQSQLLATRNRQFREIDDLITKSSIFRPDQPSMVSNRHYQSQSPSDFGMPDFIVSDGQEEW